jgi:5-methyltetrahydropteroyltriglutamate--homocysteine methyltransferase
MAGLDQLGLLPTTVVGSYPQPEWLINRKGLEKVPRVRVPDVWRIEPELLEAAQRDATVVAIHAQVLAGVDIITDGEIRRESYSNHFSNALSGIDDQPGVVEVTVNGERREVPVPSFTGEVRRVAPVEVDNARFLRSQTDRVAKVTLPGPFTMSQQAVTSCYADAEELAMALADALNAEIKDLHAAGVDLVQLDEPWMERFPEPARRYGVKTVNRTLDGVDGPVALHICFGYAAAVSDKPSRYHYLAELEDTDLDHILIEAAQPRLDMSSLAGILTTKKVSVGVLDLSDPTVESPETVAERIERALEVIGPERLMIGPDCGMKFLAADTAYGKLAAMVQGAAIVRRQLSAG